jgi:molybdopterin-guanine dinucleotide biosynthesis protein A
MTEVEPSLMGVILAGGESTRFGSPKALFPLGGRPMAAWSAQALQPYFAQVVVIANDKETGPELGLPFRGDLQFGMGPLGGLVTALAWAREEGWGGVFLLGCDLPLVRGSTLGRILEYGFQEMPILVPESFGPLGLEPLCAAYTLDCLSPARDLLNEGRRSMMGLLEKTGFTRVPAAKLGGQELLSRTFMNVNTPGEAERVGSILTNEGTSP